MSVRLQSLTPMLQTSDMAKTIAWYTSVLNFRCVAREGSWSRLERDDVALMFMKNDHLGAPHATATQYIYVSDVASPELPRWLCRTPCSACILPTCRRPR
jgi:catechol 2,3-dioxygenase-like lactoylglutathione lyase family enzyme